MSRKPKELYYEFMVMNKNYFQQHEFDLDVKTAKVKRIEKNGEKSIYFDPVWSPFNVLISPMFLFRVNQIQRIWGEFNDYMKGSDSSTLVIRLWDMCKMTSTNSEIFDIFIEDHTSLSIYNQHFIKFMDDLGWEIIDRLNSLNDYDAFINYINPMNDEFQNRVFHRKYASPGLIAAKLNHNPQYEILYEKYLDILIGFNYVDAQSELKALKTYMDAHSVEDLLSL